MKHTERITSEQIKSMHKHLGGLPTENKHKKDLKFFYNPLTPKDIYVRYSTFTLQPDNSINSEVILSCIKPNGKKTDCDGQFDNLKQRLEFESQFLEIDLDANRNIVFV
jgi:hypothetical protein